MKALRNETGDLVSGIEAREEGATTYYAQRPPTDEGASLSTCANDVQSMTLGQGARSSNLGGSLMSEQKQKKEVNPVQLQQQRPSETRREPLGAGSESSEDQQQQNEKPQQLREERKNGGEGG